MARTKAGSRVVLNPMDVVNGAKPVEMHIADAAASFTMNFASEADAVETIAAMCFNYRYQPTVPNPDPQEQVTNPNFNPDEPESQDNPKQIPDPNWSATIPNPQTPQEFSAMWFENFRQDNIRAYRKAQADAEAAANLNNNVTPAVIS